MKLVTFCILYFEIMLKVLQSPYLLLYRNDYCRCFKIVFKNLKSFAFPKITLVIHHLSFHNPIKKLTAQSLIQSSLKNTAIFNLHTTFYINPLKHNLLCSHSKIMAILSLLSSVFPCLREGKWKLIGQYWFKV